MSVEIDVRINVNGEWREAPAGTTVADLLQSLGLWERPVAVEVNRDIVPKARHRAHVLADGDLLELVTLVGGG